MTPDLVQRLRLTMRGEKPKNVVGTVGTSELRQFQQSHQQRSNKSTNTESNDFRDVLTVPTLCTLQKGKEKKSENLDVMALELASELKCEFEGKDDQRSGNDNSYPASVYDPVAFQVETDRRNTLAALGNLTDRWCRCRRMATVAVGRVKSSKINPEGVERWLCDYCFSAS